MALAVLLLGGSNASAQECLDFDSEPLGVRPTADWLLATGGLPATGQFFLHSAAGYFEIEEFPFSSGNRMLRQWGSGNSLKIDLRYDGGAAICKDTYPKEFEAAVNELSQGGKAWAYDSLGNLVGSQSFPGGGWSSVYFAASEIATVVIEGYSETRVDKICMW